jgi:sec-independent protein translocase protein TatC
LHDRRKALRAADGPDDDEASDLDLTPERIEDVIPVSASAVLPEQSDVNRANRLNGYDDVT